MIDSNKLKLVSWNIKQCHVAYVDSDAFETPSASAEFMKRIHTSTREHDDVTVLYLVSKSITTIMKKGFEQNNEISYIALTKGTSDSTEANVQFN
jgi:hypothetical protein